MAQNVRPQPRAKKLFTPFHKPNTVNGVYYQCTGTGFLKITFACIAQCNQLSRKYFEHHSCQSPAGMQGLPRCPCTITLPLFAGEANLRHGTEPPSAPVTAQRHHRPAQGQLQLRDDLKRRQEGRWPWRHPERPIT